MGLREKHRVRTHTQLAEAALALFLSKGFDETTVDEIAERAGVSRRTFFRYFESKEAAFFANMEGRLQTLRSLLARRDPSEKGIDAVLRAVIEVGDDYMAHRETALAQNQIIESSRNLMAYDQLLDAAWEGVVRDALSTDVEEFEASVQAGSIIGASRAVLRQWIEGDARGDLRTMGERAFAILAQASIFKE
jgi:AcrR family transcriptional regulator